MSNPQQIIIKLTEILQENSNVAGLVLVGSYARENGYQATEYSDLELYIIVRNEKAEDFEKELLEIVNKLGQVVFSYKNRWAGFSTVFDDLFRLELPLAKLRELDSVFSRPISQTVKVLIDKTNGELKKALDKRPKTIDFQKSFEYQVLDAWYMLVAAVQYYKKGEIWSSRSVLQIVMSSIIKLMELLQDPDLLLLENNKRVELFLSKLQINLLKKASPPYDKEQVYNALNHIIEIFSEISKKVAKKYNYEYKIEIENEIKPKLQKLLKKDS